MARARWYSTLWRRAFFTFETNGTSGSEDLRVSAVYDDELPGYTTILELAWEMSHMFAQ